MKTRDGVSFRRFNYGVTVYASVPRARNVALHGKPVFQTRKQVCVSLRHALVRSLKGGVSSGPRLDS